jgi:hypothetical protein
MSLIHDFTNQAEECVRLHDPKVGEGRGGECSDENGGGSRRLQCGGRLTMACLPAAAVNTRSRHANGRVFYYWLRQPSD